jgi:hypothetical protein
MVARVEPRLRQCLARCAAHMRLAILKPNTLDGAGERRLLPDAITIMLKEREFQARRATIERQN